MIDCYVIKYNGYADVWQDAKCDCYFVFDRESARLNLNINDFIECIHIPSLKQITFDELGIIVESFKRNSEINKLIEQKSKLQQQLEEISDKILVMAREDGIEFQSKFLSQFSSNYFDECKIDIAENDLKCTLTNTNQELINECQKWIDRLFKSGEKSWTLHLPYKADDNPDLLFSELCRRFTLLCAIDQTNNPEYPKVFSDNIKES